MKTRNFAPDLVRVVAVAFVLGAHSFMYNGFFETVVQGPAMMLAVYIRVAMMTCVPMFMMLTGYLCLNKAFSAKYYSGIFHTLLVYFFASIGCLVYRMVWGGETFSFMGMIRRIVDFTAAPYSWYVEMYIGLFLLIPFINTGWRNMNDTMKIVLMISLVIISTLYAVTNREYKYVTDWWSGLYPITYYVIGAWLREHPIKWKKRWLFLAFVLITGLTLLLQLDIFGGQLYGWHPSNNRGSILILGETVMLFSLLMSVKGDKWPRPLKWCVSQVAKLSFGLYLFSYISDMLIYPIANRYVSGMFSALAVMPLCVAAGILMSAVGALIANTLTKYVIKAGGIVLAPLFEKTTKEINNK